MKENKKERPGKRSLIKTYIEKRRLQLYLMYVLSEGEKFKWTKKSTHVSMLFDKKGRCLWVDASIQYYMLVQLKGEKF